MCMSNETLLIPCPRCNKDVDTNWEEKDVPDVIQDDPFGRTKMATESRITCKECGYIIQDWSDEE